MFSSLRVSRCRCRCNSISTVIFFFLNFGYCDKPETCYDSSAAPFTGEFRLEPVVMATDYPAVVVVVVVLMVIVEVVV
jgi:hypothetical protein